MNQNRFHDVEQLLRLLQEDPSAGLETAIDQYGGAVRTICRSVLGQDAAEVEECISDVFVALWQSAASFDSRAGSLKSYLYGIARHKAIDRLRRMQKQQSPLPLEETDLGQEMDFSADLAARQNSEILQATIDGLPSPDREIFIYRYYFFERVKDIAERLSLPPKTVENRLYRGKAILKEELLERGIIL